MQARTVQQAEVLPPGFCSLVELVGTGPHVQVPQQREVPRSTLLGVSLEVTVHRAPKPPSAGS